MKHPEGKIMLLDGSLIEGFPRQTTPQGVDYKPQLKDVGEQIYFHEEWSMTWAEIQALCAERKRLEKLFYENAFFLWSRAERILSDSRMFLAPLAVESGVACIGTSLRNLTLGMYIEWWTNYMASRIIYNDGTTDVIWRLAGVPHRGISLCDVVNEQGISSIGDVYLFGEAWKSMIKINKRYEECKKMYEAYSLEEVLDILRSEPEDPEHYKQFMLKIQNEALQTNIERLHSKIKEKDHYIGLLHDENNNTWGKYNKLRVSIQLDKAQKVLADCAEKERICQEKLEKQHLRRRTAKAHREEYTATEFQNEMSDIKRMKKMLKEELQQFQEDAVKELFPDDVVTINALQRYVKEILTETNNKQ